MNKDEIIARLITENFELRDKLAEANELKNSFFNQWQESVKNSIPVRPLTMEDTAPVFAHMEVPNLG